MREIEEGYLGRYIPTHRRRVNIHTLINSFYPSRPAFEQTAVIVGNKEYPDVSFYQGDIDWNMMRSKTDTVIIRAGQNEWVDTKFLHNWSEAKKRGMIRGTYWFYDGRKSPGSQAELFVSLVKSDPPEMEMIVDWERSYSGAFEGLSNVVAMMQRVEQLMSCMTMLYTGYYWFTGNSNPIANANQYNWLEWRPLHEAWYTSNPAEVRIPNPPWSSLLLWQYGTPSLDYGQETIEIDMNRVNLTDADFYARYKATEPEPPNGGTMAKYKLLVDLNMRAAPIDGAVLLTLPKGTFIWGVLDTATNWIRVAKYQKVNEPERLFSAWCSGYPQYVELVPETPTAKPETVDVVLTAGSTITVKDAAGNVIWSGTA